LDEFSGVGWERRNLRACAGGLVYRGESSMNRESLK
jgi:hypothetical protein